MVRHLEASPIPRFEDIEKSRLEAFTTAIESTSRKATSLCAPMSRT